jgi:DNA-binding transcriptional ArsR family regulator
LDDAPAASPASRGRTGRIGDDGGEPSGDYQPKLIYRRIRSFDVMTEDHPGQAVEGTTIEDVLDAMGDQYARDVLAAICRESRSAKELAEELDHSLQTVYRRIDLLEEHELVTAHTRIAADGNHHQVYDSNFDSVLISMEDDEYDVRIYRRDDLPERFGDLWDDLSGG